MKSIIKRAARKLGYEIKRVPAFSADPEYQVVRPVATYSPWNTDTAFRDAYSIAEASTLVDIYRCYEIWTLVEQVSKLSSGSLIEIGVWKGGTGVLIAKQAERCRITEKVFLCDTFAGVVKAGPDDTFYKGGEHADTSLEAVQDLIKDQALSNVEILQGVFPEETGIAIEDVSFRFCHIDVDVYQSAEDILDWVWDKMVAGGVVVYDDFGFDECRGIVKHVKRQASLNERLVIHNLNGHAVLIKL